jgi:hypothetical protein
VRVLIDEGGRIRLGYVVHCEQCGHDNALDQDNFLHAGFGDVGFLYNEAGTQTLIWSTFDPAYVKIVGEHHPWALNPEQRAALEDALRPAPTGGRWLFANPPRCVKCGSAVGTSIIDGIYYFWYPGSLYARENREFTFARYLR